MRRALFWLLLVFTLAACADPNTNTPPLITQFDAESDALTVTFRWQLIEPDGDALTCQLDVDGDGVFEYTIRDCATNTSQTHRYLAPGQYDIMLVVDDGKGESSVRQQSLSLSALMPGNTPPDIDDFRAIPATGDSPLATTFTWLVFDADGDTLSCVLDPADGSEPYVFEDCNLTSSQPHIYYDAGAFAARLTVDDGGGGISQREASSQVRGAQRLNVQGNIQLNVAAALAPAWRTFIPPVSSSTDMLTRLLTTLGTPDTPRSQLLARDSSGRVVAEAPIRSDGSFRMQLASDDPVQFQVALVATPSSNPRSTSTRSTSTRPDTTSDNVSNAASDAVFSGTVSSGTISANTTSVDTTPNVTADRVICTWQLADMDGERWLEPRRNINRDTNRDMTEDIALGTFQLNRTQYISSSSDLAANILSTQDPSTTPTTLRVSASDPCPSHEVRGQLLLDGDPPPDGFVNVIYALADTATGYVAVAAAPIELSAATPEDTFALELPTNVAVRLLLTRAGESSLDVLPLWSLASALTVTNDTDLGTIALNLTQRQGQIHDASGSQSSNQDAFIITHNASNDNAVARTHQHTSNQHISDQHISDFVTLTRSRAGSWQTWLPTASLPAHSSAYPLDINNTSSNRTSSNHTSSNVHPLATWTDTRDTTTPYILRADDVSTTANNTDSNTASNSNTATSRSLTRNRPVVDIRPVNRSKRGDTIDLDASASFDPNGLPLSYIWRWLERPNGSRSRLSDEYSEQVRFTPDIAGEYVLELLVSNGERVTIDTVTLDVQDNRPPEVSLEAVTEMSLGNSLDVQAIIADSDDDSVGVRWQLEQTPEGSRLNLAQNTRRLDLAKDDLSGDFSDVHMLTLTPDKAGEYVVSVVVSDGDVETRSSQRIAVFDDFVVTHAGSSGRGSLRWALEVANATPGANTITIQALTEAVILARPLDVRDDLTIQIAPTVPTPLPLTLQASGTDMRLMEVQAGVSLTMSDVHFTGGRAGTQVQQGGALYIHEGAQVSLTACRFTDNGAQTEGGAVANFGQLELFNCHFEGNLATRGGAMYAAASSHTQLIDSVFVANSAARAGGAVYQAGWLEGSAVRWQANGTSGSGGALWSSGTLTLDRNHFDDNQAGSGGGAIWQQSGRINVDSSHLQGNLTTNGRGGAVHLRDGARAVLQRNQWQANRSDSDNGGALFIGEGAYAEVSSSTFYDNSAQQFAGAIDNFGRLHLHSSSLRGNHADKAAALSNGTGAHATVDSSLFVANRAVQFAGAIANFAALELNNSTLSDNYAAFGGAILSGNNATHTHITHSTIVANRAPQGGAGILHGQGDTTLADSIILGNLSEALTGDCVHTDDSPSRVTSQGHNVLGRGGGCTADANDIILAARALFEDVLAPLADNGGSTYSHALLPASPALDAGSLASGQARSNYPPFDQRGQGFVRVSGQALDIGAFETASQNTETQSTQTQSTETQSTETQSTQVPSTETQSTDSQSAERP